MKRRMYARKHLRFCTSWEKKWIFMMKRNWLILFPESVIIKRRIIVKRAFRQHEVGSDDIIMTADQTVNSGDEVDEMIAALEATGYLQTIFQKLREKNRMDYEIYVGVTVYGIPSRLVAEHYHITENNVNNKVMRTRRWLAREYDALCDAQDLY